jgi:hypothetical protein
MRSFDEWANNLAEHISTKTNKTSDEDILESDNVTKFMNHLAFLSDLERAILLEHVISSSFIWQDVKFWSSVCASLRQKNE